MTLKEFADQVQGLLNDQTANLPVIFRYAGGEADCHEASGQAEVYDCDECVEVFIDAESSEPRGFFLPVV
jgi:hypothetical protein